MENHFLKLKELGLIETTRPDQFDNGYLAYFDEEVGCFYQLFFDGKIKREIFVESSNRWASYLCTEKKYSDNETLVKRCIRLIKNYRLKQKQKC